MKGEGLKVKGKRGILKFDGNKGCKMIFVKRYSAIFRVLLLTLLLTGCAAEQVKTRYVWPLPPDPPRIEWLAMYHNDSELRPNSIWRTILGDTDPVNLKRPLYIASNGNGKVIVGDTFEAMFRIFDFTAKEVRTVGGDKLIGDFTLPTGVAFDQDNSFYLASGKTRTIYHFSPNEVFQRSFDLTGQIKFIGSFALDKVRRRLIVPDTMGHQVGIFDLNGKLIKMIGKRGDGNGEFNTPVAVAVDRNGQIAVCDSNNARIQLLTPEGEFIRKFGIRGDGIGDFQLIKGVAYDSEGHIYVTDGKGNKVLIFSDKGEFLLRFGGLSSVTDIKTVTPGGFHIPQGIYIDQNDTIYIADQLNGRFQVFQYMNEKYLKEHPITKDTQLPN